MQVLKYEVKTLEVKVQEQYILAIVHICRVFLFWLDKTKLPHNKQKNHLSFFVSAEFSNET